MKIGSLPAVAMEQYNNSKIRTRKTETAGGTTDSLEVTHSSRLFSEALQAVQQTPDVREDKVEALRSQVANGTYVIDSAAIAARILSGIGM
ncbi:MAG: flagellar biosynthesis anti-sigma factor FlgM [Oscillospiraceae bacterium]|nr:flagellar biosynthesis anti-sigma factor FlgM [Oscillospiraceae bacterium]